MAICMRGRGLARWTGALSGGGKNRPGVSEAACARWWTGEASGCMR